MNNQAQQPSPCPECGGARVPVGYSISVPRLGRRMRGKLEEGYDFWAVCCTRCGHMTQYASQEFIAQALEAARREQREAQEWLVAEQRRQQEWLAKEAARQQKRQQK
jgi:hypothetical protein